MNLSAFTHVLIMLLIQFEYIGICTISFCITRFECIDFLRMSNVSAVNLHCQPSLIRYPRQPAFVHVQRGA